MKKILTIALLATALGCSMPFYKNVDGEDDLVGIALPTEADIQINAIHHINGDKIVVKDASSIQHEWKVASSNSYFGIIKIYECRYGKISVCPTNCVHKK